jgi:hypothetical protein
MFEKWRRNSLQMLLIGMVVIIASSVCAAISSTWYASKEQTVANAILSSTKNLADAIPLAPYFTETRM